MSDSLKEMIECAMNRVADEARSFEANNPQANGGDDSTPWTISYSTSV